jgi:hypothetical protein
MCQFHVDDWGIHQGPPSTSLFLSTSTHHPGIRLRNQLVPWDLHASMECLLASDGSFTSLTSYQMIPRVFDLSSFIHICWNVLRVPWESLSPLVISLALVNNVPQ